MEWRKPFLSPLATVLGSVRNLMFAALTWNAETCIDVFGLLPGGHLCFCWELLSEFSVVSFIDSFECWLTVLVVTFNNRISPLCAVSGGELRTEGCALSESTGPGVLAVSPDMQSIVRQIRISGTVTSVSCLISWPVDDRCRIVQR